MPSNNFVRDFHGREPSVSGYVDHLPSRRPSQPEYSTSHMSPVKRAGGYQDGSPSPPHSAPQAYSRSRTISSVSRQGGVYDNAQINGHGDPHSQRGRPNFVSSPSQLSHSRVDLGYTLRAEQDPSPNWALAPAPQGSSHSHGELAYASHPEQDRSPSQAPVLPQGNVPPEDEFSKNLADAWGKATTAPKVSKVDKAPLLLGAALLFSTTQ